FKVNVVTAFPYYPQWEIARAYKNRPNYIVEDFKGMKLYRYKQFTPKQPSFLKRVLHILDFTKGTYFNLRKVERPDIVISVIPFTASAFLGNRHAKKHRAKHWVHIQDFEFDAAFQSGLLHSKKNKQGTLQKQLMGLERRTLNRAHRVSTISHLMLKKLKSKTTTPTCFLPNWIDGEQIDPATAARHPFLKSEKFKILYSGNIGDKQNWQLFKKIAAKLPAATFQFVIVGDGAKRSGVETAVAAIPNASYHPPVALSALSSLLCSADAHFLFQKMDVLDTVMPSKILGMMASGKPSVITGHPASEVRTTVRAANAGFYICSEDVGEIAQAFQKLRDDKAKTAAMGTQARRYVLSNFSKEEILSQFAEQLHQL
ncbi:MAG: WcaI family glycosyltransferase, partial [Marinirhabdus sp.]